MMMLTIIYAINVSAGDERNDHGDPPDTPGRRRRLVNHPSDAGRDTNDANNSVINAGKESLKASEKSQVKDDTTSVSTHGGENSGSSQSGPSPSSKTYSAGGVHHQKMNNPAAKPNSDGKSTPGHKRGYTRELEKRMTRLVKNQ